MVSNHDQVIMEGRSDGLEDDALARDSRVPGSTFLSDLDHAAK